jgi:hypothetical protein
MPRLNTRRPQPRGHVRPGAILAAIIVETATPGQPAKFKLKHGDGRIMRGMWGTRGDAGGECSHQRVPPQAGDQACALFNDDGDAWLIYGPF